MSLALVFSPQGAQSVGMGRALAEASPAAADVYRTADEVLGWPVSTTCWEGPKARLDDTRQTQPCLVATSVACLRALEEATGPLWPSFVAGHSVGEYAALVAAGTLAFGDALRLVERRALLMAETGESGGMAAVIGLDREAVMAVVTAVARPTELVVANDNAPGQVVISGDRDALARARGALREAGARRVLPLAVSGAFHSPRMGPVAESLARAFRDVSWHDADPPVLSNASAEPVSDADIIRRLLAEQVRSPVEWVASVQRMVSDGVTLFVECGPGSVLGGMIRRIDPTAGVATTEDPARIAAAVEAVEAQRASGRPVAAAKAPA